MPYSGGIFKLKYSRVVKKMKLKLFLLLMTSAFVAGEALATANAGLRYINTRAQVRCGTEQGTKAFAWKDEDGNWHGIDADICRMISTAVFGRNDRFVMVPLAGNQVSKALTSNKIDVMLGGLAYSANNEITTQAAPAAILYYDNQTFLAQGGIKATSMESFKGSRVCVVNDSDDLSKLKTYNNKYQLDFAILPFANLARAKEAFFLKRCTLLTGNSLLMKDILVNSPSGTSGVEMLPEIVTTRPVYIYTEKDNTTLRSVIRWIINAPLLAEDAEITSENIDMAMTTQDPSLSNLLGIDDRLWKKFGLNPAWVPMTIKESGNFGEMFERNIGSQSKFKLPRGENNLIKNQGHMIPDPFL